MSGLAGYDHTLIKTQFEKRINLSQEKGDLSTFLVKIGQNWSNIPIYNVKVEFVGLLKYR